MKRNFLSLLMLLGAAQVQVQAQKTNSSHSIDSLDVLTPVEVKAIRAGSKSPFALTNVHSTAIAQKNLGQNLPYLLEQTPSVVVSSDDGLGVGYTSLRVRGTDITRTNFTINGIPVNDPESQGVFFVNFADIASSANSIQIQRGVGSSTNGSGAFGASVNISNAAQSLIPFAEISNAYGSFNTWKHTVRVGSGKLKNGFQSDIRLSKINSNGYIDRSASDLKSLQFITGWTSKDERTNIKFNLFTGKEKTGQAWNGIGVKFNQDAPANTVNYQDSLNKIGRNNNFIGLMKDGKYYNDQTDNYQQDYYQLFLHQKINTHWNANVGLFMTRGKGYYNEYKNGDYGDGEKLSSYGLPPFIKAPGDTVKRVALIRQLWLDNYYYGSVYAANYNTDATNIHIGGAYTVYKGKHYGFVKWAEMGVNPDYKYYGDLPAHKTDMNIFVKWQQLLYDGLYSFVDIQYRNVDYKINGFRKRQHLISGSKYNFLNPKLGLSYYITHSTGNSKIYGSFAVANKEPNRDDFEANTQKPKHETLYDYELGYQFIAPKLHVGVNLYYMDYKNQLILTGQINDVGASTRTNVNKSYRSGIELTASYQPKEWMRLSGHATFSKNKVKEIVQYYDDYDNGSQYSETFKNTDIAFSPNLIAGGTLTVEPFMQKTGDNHLFVDILGKYVGRQYLDNTQNALRSINPYSLIDVRFRYLIKSSWINNASIIVGLNNVLNRQYENNGYTFSYAYGSKTTENYYFPQAGFNYNVGIVLGL